MTENFIVSIRGGGQDEDAGGEIGCEGTPYRWRLVVDDAQVL